MAKLENVEIVLECLGCKEYLHVRMVGEVFNHKGKECRRFKQEVFCPLCDKSDNIRNQYKNQRDEQKKRESKI